MQEEKGSSKQNSLFVKLYRKYVTREIITYGIAGVLTTVVNLIIFHIFANSIGIDEMISNVIAWVGAVAFAYIVNDVWVFKSKRTGLSDEIAKIIKFIGARVASLGVEEVGIFIFVKQLHFNNMLVKCGLAVIVILMNYIFSKLFIFNKKSK